MVVIVADFTPGCQAFFGTAFIAGPCSTADIERTPAIGAHDPERLDIIVTPF